MLLFSLLTLDRTLFCIRTPTFFSPALFFRTIKTDDNNFHHREGLQWTDIDWNDNGECLDLVERVSVLNVSFIIL